jgi:hypothetical protein
MEVNEEVCLDMDSTSDDEAESIENATMAGPGEVREKDGANISGEVEDIAVDGDQNTESGTLKLREVS